MTTPSSASGRRIRGMGTDRTDQSSTRQAPVNTRAVSMERQGAAGVDLSTLVLRSHRRDVVVAIVSHPGSPLHVSV